MEVASFATFARTGSPKGPISSLCNDSLSSRSALALTSSRVAAYVSAFSRASFLARRTRDCNSSTASYRSNMFNGRFRCLRRVINASSVLLRALSSSEAFNFFSRVWIRSTGWETRKNTGERKTHLMFGWPEQNQDIITKPKIMGKWNFVTTNPPFVVETYPVFALQNLHTHLSTTRFHSPLYPPLNNLTPLKILFSYKMNAPHPLPFLLKLRTLSSPTFYQSLILPFRHFLPLFFESCLSFLHYDLSRFLSHLFSPHLFLSPTSIFSFVSPSCQGCFSPFSLLSPFIL